MTPEQQALLTKAQRSLAAAQSLIEQGFYDFAVSRAYYAMFYVAEALLDQEGLSFSRGYLQTPLTALRTVEIP